MILNRNPTLCYASMEGGEVEKFPADSTTEAEYIAAFEAAKEAV
jgi:hypothetical protein